MAQPRRDEDDQDSDESGNDGPDQPRVTSGPSVVLGPTIGPAAATRSPTAHDGNPTPERIEKGTSRMAASGCSTITGYFAFGDRRTNPWPFWSEAAGLKDEPPGIHTDDDRHRRICGNPATDGRPCPQHLPRCAHSRFGPYELEPGVLQL